MLAVDGVVTVNIRFGKSSIYNPTVQVSDTTVDAIKYQSR